MRFIDFGQEATGFIAIGQFATGVFAFGQVAVGVVAVGQVALGGFVVGQGAVGLLSIGMGGIGVYWTGAMLGVGGSGFGGVVPLAPGPGKAVDVPDTVSWKAATHDSWVACEVGVDTPSRLAVPDGVRVRADLRGALAAADPADVVVHVVKGHHGLEVDRVMALPGSRLTNPMWWGIWAAQWASLALLCTLYVGALILPWLAALWAS